MRHMSIPGPTPHHNIFMYEYIVIITHNHHPVYSRFFSFPPPPLIFFKLGMMGRGGGGGGDVRTGTLVLLCSGMYTQMYVRIDVRTYIRSHPNGDYFYPPPLLISCMIVQDWSNSALHHPHRCFIASNQSSRVPDRQRKSPHKIK